MTQITTRICQFSKVHSLVEKGIHPVLARLYASRGIDTPADIETVLTRLLPPNQLLSADNAAVLLADAITMQQQILVVADYDCDGATACAVAVRGLRLFGAYIDYLVPNRFEYGHGLTPDIVDLAARRSGTCPNLLITVDNGMASIEGVAAANALGINVLITDHHLPGDTLPAASAIVNPNQLGCIFPSKHLAGVGVIFYVLLALRVLFRQRGAYNNYNEPRLDSLLDLVALGTVADVVELDLNNRVLVAQGLQRIRNGKMQPGIAALFRSAARDTRNASAFDLGFALGPRLNAAGRLSDMSLGIECLVTDDTQRADVLAQQLDAINCQRRKIEAEIQEEALAALVQFNPRDKATITLFNPTWHQGVIGIVASRLKERFHRPAIMFALTDKSGNHVTGSGRSIPGFHLRDALDLVSKREPGLIKRFGGHAMAAGLTLRTSDVPRFSAIFEVLAHEWINEGALTRQIQTDGELEDIYHTLSFIDLIDKEVWGQGFPAPIFSAEFDVVSQSLIKERHLRLQLARGHLRFTAIWFNHTDVLPTRALFAYRLTRNTWNSVSRVQLVVEHVMF
ncbi:single-stranded-DNA-specific exonuclease RecJ [Candidatus Vallotia tarda]|uniref:Single-stranded-DNA-specific exonuclease RecJ n=1 Tax=Candidatus Vallotiella hemipterorum TaxID=1177213 RepID=A0A916JTI2_9BURK|nr:single-stranded-DNA-specific exonuclease RecJ [Candidatus Vallotia tarda]CAG7601617.1 Single-stranded-DNA-specific exonuclease RecJ [Candidatus Vallotia tarda]